MAKEKSHQDGHGGSRDTGLRDREPMHHAKGVRITMKALHPSAGIVAVTLAASVLAQYRALGWGNEGHEVVALIAFEQLQPPTKAFLNRIFAVDDGMSGMTLPEKMMHAAIWPDQIKTEPSTPVSIFGDLGVNDAEQSKPLHYVDFEGDSYNEATDCPNGQCAIRGIAECRKVLSDRASGPEARLEAVKFLIHLVGDIHQPLHVGRKTDKGGNDIKIAAFLSRRPRNGFNLHSVWDNLIIQKTDRDPNRYANSLVDGLSDDNKADYGQETDPEKWAAESHKLAMEVAYKNVDGSDLANGAALDSTYYQQALPVVEKQLCRAGIRLAKMLDDLAAAQE